MLKPPEFESDPITGPIICPIMSGRSVFPIGVQSSPLGLKGPGVQEVQLIKTDKLVYCQAEGCAWYNKQINECIVHVLMNVRELVDILRKASFNPDSLRNRVERAREGLVDEALITEIETKRRE